MYVNWFWCLVNEVIYLIVHGVSRITNFVVIIGELCVWMGSVNMSFKRVS